MSQSNFLPDTIWRCKALLNGKQRVSTIRNGQRKPYDLTKSNWGIECSKRSGYLAIDLDCQKPEWDAGFFDRFGHDFWLACIPIC